MIKLREYQEQAVQSVWDWFENGGHAPLVVTPTGSGKSVILAEIIKQAIAIDPSAKIAVVTHVKELVEQNTKAIERLCPLVRVGVYSAGLRRKQVLQVTVASVQSCFNKEAFHGFFDLIIIDECHLMSHKGTGMYRTLMEKSVEKNPYLKLIGLTATPFRLDSGLLHKGDGAMFDGICFDAEVGTLTAQGYLCPLVSTVGDNTDLSGVKITAGEYNIGALNERMNAIALVRHHAGLIKERAKDRKSVLIFSVTVEHAIRISESLNEIGVSADFVHGAMNMKDRDSRIAKFKSGEIKALVNCAILTTGFDYPAIDCIALLRPTMSAGLFVQMCGRGLRIHESKKDCLILDFGGNFKRHGFIDQISTTKVHRKKKEKGDAPVKECEECHAVCPINARECEQCGFLFKTPERTNEKEQYTGAVLSTQIKPEWLDVTSVKYSRHKGKDGKRDTLRVDYFCGLLKVSEWVCVEHQGFAQREAFKWLLSRSQKVSTSIDEVLKMDLKKPSRILVLFAGKFPKIIKHEFNVLTNNEHLNTVMESNNLPF